MKKIEAYIQHRFLPRVLSALKAQPDFPGITVIEVLGHGAGPEHDSDYLHTEQNIAFHRRDLIQVVVHDVQAQKIVDLIRAAAHSGTSGDGIVLVTSVESAFRISSGEKLP